MKYLYFAEGTPTGTGTACMFPASSFKGLDPISATTTRISFQQGNGQDGDDDVVLTHASGAHKDVAELIAFALKEGPITKTKFIVVADEANGIYLDVGNGAALGTPVEVTTLAT